MKVVISGREYGAASLGKVSLLDSLELKKQTGLSLPRLQEALDGIDPNADPASLYDNESQLLAFAAFIWLMRRREGDRIPFEEAVDFPLTELSFVAEDGDPTPTPPEPPRRRKGGGAGAKQAAATI
jgi:hypothetical protein